MTSLGVLLVILGVGSLILPNLGFQFRLMELVDPYQPWVGVIVAAVGLITVLFGSRRGGKEAVPAEAAPVAAAAPPAAAAAAPPAAPEASAPPASAPAATPPAAAPPAETPTQAWPTDPPERSDD
jgi:predicted lipid-binding transport protein (Tim44 family)